MAARKNLRNSFLRTPMAVNLFSSVDDEISEISDPAADAETVARELTTPLHSSVVWGTGTLAEGEGEEGADGLSENIARPTWLPTYYHS